MQAVENATRNWGGMPRVSPIGTMAASAAAWLVVNAATLKIAMAMNQRHCSTRSPMALMIWASFAPIQVSASQAMPNRAIRPMSPDDIVLWVTTSLRGALQATTMAVAVTPMMIWIITPVLSGTKAPVSSG